MAQRTHRQFKVRLTSEQFEALEREAAKRGISKAALLREAIAVVTGVKSDVRPTKFAPGLQGNLQGFAKRNSERRSEGDPES